MEDVLEVYKRPYNKLCPVVCLDETSRQLIGESRPSLPIKQGDVKKVDYEYRRNGVVDIFMMFEPLAGKRQVVVTDTRKRTDFAHCIKLLADKYYSDCEKIVLVMDNLNTHSIASLYATFPPDEARRLADKIEIHYTPKHASWLNMAEIEIGILSRQCLSKYLAVKAEIVSSVTAWCSERNKKACRVNWQFTTSDARIKLKKLYPIIEETNFL